MLEVIKKATFIQGKEKLVLEPGKYDVVNYSPEEGGYLAVEFIKEGTMKFAGGSVKWVA